MTEQTEQLKKEIRDSLDKEYMNKLKLLTHRTYIRAYNDAIIDAASLASREGNNELSSHIRSLYILKDKEV